MKIGIITDIHENVTVLENALRLAEKGSCDHIACLGDIVGYDCRFQNNPFRRSASHCVSLVRSYCRWVVAGNHDLFAAQRLPLYANGFTYPDQWFSMTPRERRLASDGMVWSYETEEPGDLKDEDREYLISLPEYLTVNEGSKEILLSHYICPDFTGSTTRTVLKQKHMNELWDFMRSHEVSLSFSGHFHKQNASFAHRRSLPFVKALHSVPGERIFLGEDVTMVLLPPLTGVKGRTTCAVLDTGSMLLSLIHERI